MNEGLQQLEGPVVSYVVEEVQGFNANYFVGRLFDQYYYQQQLTIQMLIAGFYCNNFTLVSSYLGDSFPYVLNITDADEITFLQSIKQLIGEDCLTGKLDTPIVAVSFQYVQEDSSSKISDIGSSAYGNYITHPGILRCESSILILNVCVKFQL